MTSILPFVLAGATYLDPQNPHAEVSEAIARVVDESPSLFQDDDSKRRTAALMLAVAFREGSLRANVVGDFVNGKPTSWCTFQISIGEFRTREGWSGPELRDDAFKCATVGLRMLRSSMSACPKVPLAVYAVGGPAACRSERAARISRDRMALAVRILAAAEATGS